jgi:hypothetical protein
MRKNTKVEKYPLPWCRILLMDELTDHGNDPWIYYVDHGVLVPDKTLLWGLIAACKTKILMFPLTDGFPLCLIL